MPLSIRVVKVDGDLDNSDPEDYTLYEDANSAVNNTLIKQFSRDVQTGTKLFTKTHSLGYFPLAFGWGVYDNLITGRYAFFGGAIGVTATFLIDAAGAQVSETQLVIKNPDGINGRMTGVVFYDEGVEV